MITHSIPTGDSESQSIIVCYKVTSEYDKYNFIPYIEVFIKTPTILETIAPIIARVFLY